MDMDLGRWLPITGALVGTVVGLTRNTLTPYASLDKHIIHHVGPVLVGLLLGCVGSFIWKRKKRS